MQHRYTNALLNTIALASFLSLGAGLGGTITASASPATHAAIGPRTVAKSPTVHSATSRVDGKSETILVNSRGLPLYYYEGDTARKSFVSGGLASLWPPLLSAKPTATGIRGKLSALEVAAGHQVTYNGHFLYTFVEDSSDQVTGQGVSNFFVATPGLKVIGSASGVTSSAPTSSGNGYGY
jgi:predicted lipoprotein with Yx(FWY)xxD motif